MNIILSALSIVIGIAGFLYAVVANKRRRKERLHRQQRFEWNHIYQGVRQICRDLLKSGFRPELLIGVPGAGLIITELTVIELGDVLPVYIIQQLPKSSIEDFPLASGASFNTEKWKYWIPSEILALKDKKVLVIDDYAPSGDTLTFLKKELIKQGFKKDNIRTAVLVAPESLRETNKAPDIIWFWVDSTHVYMPWGHGSKRVRKNEII